MSDNAPREATETVIDFVLKNRGLLDAVMLDAAVGIGNATRQWAEALDQNAGERLIGVDLDYLPGWRSRFLTSLGDQARLVDLRQDDIFRLDTIEDGSIDIINCADTLIFLETRPLRSLAALQQFDRVLKPGGWLIIISELPVNDRSVNAAELQWRRWNLAKAIWDLSGETWSTEPLGPDLRRALSLLGFEAIEEYDFPSVVITKAARGIVDEWRERMRQRLARIPWERLRRPLSREIDEIHRCVLETGELLGPGKYALISTKKADPISGIRKRGLDQVEQG